jgi:hypothetical protein
LSAADSEEQVKGFIPACPLPPAPHNQTTHRKLRNYWFFLAREKTQELIFNYRDIEFLINDIYKYSINYIQDIENKVIVLSKNNEFLIIPYLSRFNPEYIKRKKKLFKKLAYRLKNVIGRHTFLTITYDPKNITSLNDMRYQFTKSLTKFLDLLKKKYHYLAIIKTYEFTKSGLIHAHILILNVPHINKDWLTKTLKLCGLGRIKKIKEFKGITEHSLNYFIKHFSKSFNSLDYLIKGNSNLTLSWALNLRTYSLSHSLYCLLDVNKSSIEKKGWIYQGIFEDKGEYGIVGTIRFYQLYGAG